MYHDMRNPDITLESAPKNVIVQRGPRLPTIHFFYDENGLLKHLAPVRVCRFEECRPTPLPGQHVTRVQLRCPYGHVLDSAEAGEAKARVWEWNEQRNVYPLWECDQPLPPTAMQRVIAAEKQLGLRVGGDDYPSHDHEQEGTA